MSSEIERRYRQDIPESHRVSLDTRLLWLWHQRFGTVQTVYANSEDILDRTAATLILQCIFGKDLKSIRLLFQRLEGLPSYDSARQAQIPATRI